MAATQTMSPGGALLRSSRMFAIPKPLPKPKGKLAAGSIFDSETSTLPYPTHLAITTPPSSLARGDWGLKRPLPLRSTTKSSTPILRVKTVDTYEHVTEYESAADHALTLKKWQGLSLPLLTPFEKKNVFYDTDGKNKPRKSVFEKELDYTVQREPPSGEQDPRWKFNGPWLAGQTELEFNEFLKKQVRHRRNEFTEFLRQQCAKELNIQVKEESISKGRELVVISDETLTEDQFNAYVKKLRKERVELFTLIRKFLDLPPAPHLSRESMEDLDVKPGSTFDMAADSAESKQPLKQSPYARGGPPKTHPSAGLSYLRTGAVIPNHPLFGPQAANTPVKSRVIMPSGASGGATATAKLGVAGVVTSVPTGAAGFNFSKLPGNNRDKYSRKTITAAGFSFVDIDTYGGTKVFVDVTGASINPSGTVQLTTAAASDMSINIAEGKAWKAPPKKDVSFRERQSGGSIFRSVDLGGKKEKEAEQEQEQEQEEELRGGRTPLEMLNDRFKNMPGL